jgi:hypothetical protein
MRGRKKGYTNNLSISPSDLECWFWIHLPIFFSPSKLLLNSQDIAQDRPRWLGFPTCSRKAHGRDLYKRKINQPAAVNFVWIFRFGAYGSYGNTYGSVWSWICYVVVYILTITFSSELWFEWCKMRWKYKNGLYKISISFLVISW